MTGCEGKCVCARPYYGAVWGSARGPCWLSHPLPTKTSRLFIQSCGMDLVVWRMSSVMITGLFEAAYLPFSLSTHNYHTDFPTPSHVPLCHMTPLDPCDLTSQW